MIHINLLPGSVSKKKRKSSALPLPSMGKSKINMPQFDRVLATAIGMWVVGVALILWMHLSVSSRLQAATIDEERLVADTARLQAQLAQNRLLMGKRDTVSAKLTIIQELDAGRYNWAHLLDEISRAVPDYTWLTNIGPRDTDDPRPAFIIEGRMGNAFALPKLMQALEASPFISNVTLRASAPVVEDGKPVYSFLVEATYEDPPLDVISTVPLFAGEQMSDSVASPAAPVAAPATPAAPATAGRN
ncbi:MAG TPA: PilN domain-containing protein [Longimicrobiales bacterium]